MDVTLSVGLDTKPYESQAAKLAADWAAQVARFEKPTAVKFDANAARATIQQLAGSFGTLDKRLNDSASTQKAALAALVLSGAKGSAEYNRLAESIRKDQQELERLADAAREVEREFSSAPKLDVDTEQAQTKLEKLKTLFSGGGGAAGAFAFNQIQSAVTTMSGAFSDVIAEGSEFEATLAAVGAITGSVGPPLDELGDKARALALQFGGSASDQLRSFQGILSKLGPQMGESAAAMELMGRNVNVLSAASGDAADTSMAAIVDSMLQFGLATGDAMRDAETSTRIINGLAAGAQVGAAEIPQVAEAILQAGVAAKGARLSFEATNAAIQTLAVGGKTGSEAGVALRNVLGLIQKASGPAEASMKKLGTSSKELGEILTSQGLDAALAKLKGGLDTMGSAAERNSALMTIFGTENSAAAGILLDNLPKLREFEEGIIAGQSGLGSAFEQAAIRMDTAQSEMDRAQAAIKDGLISTFQTVGSGFSSIVGTSAKIAPLVSTFSGLKSVIPTEAIGKAASGLKDLLVPALLKLGIIKATNIAATGAETAAELANAGAKTAQAAATGVATGAQWSLNAAMLANPIGLIIAGLAALAIGYAAFSSSTKELGDATKDASAALEQYQSAAADANTAQKQATDLQNLSAEYERLKTATDPASQQRFAEVSQQLAARVPEAATAVEQLNSSGEKVGETYRINTGEVKRFADETLRLAEIARQEALANLNDQSRALADSFKEATAEQAELRQQQEEYRKLVADGLGDQGSRELVGNPFESISDDLKDVNAELAEQNKKIAAAEPEIRKILDGYQLMGKSVAQIAAETGFSEEIVRKYGGALSGTVVSADALEKSIARLPQAQQESIRRATLQAEEYKKAQANVDDLEQKLKAIEITGGDTSELQKQLDAAREEAKKEKIEFDLAVKTEGGDKLFTGLDESARKELNGLVDMVGDSMQETKSRILQEDLGKAITTSAQIKEKLDKTGEVDALISKIKSAKTEAERNNAMKELADAVPQAVSGFNRVTGVFEVNIDAAERFNEAQKKGLGQDRAKEREKAIAVLKDQAAVYRENKAEVDRLGQKIAEVSARGGDTSKYRQEWEKAKKATEESAKAISTTIEQGQKVGLLSADVKNYGTELGLAAEDADSVAEANARIQSSAQQAALDVKSIAAAYNETKQAAESAATDSFGAVRGLQEELRTLQKIPVASLTVDQAARLKELPGLIKQEIANARTHIAEQNRLARGDKSLQIQLGTLDINTKDFAEEAKRVEEEINKIRLGIRSSRIADDTARAMQEVSDQLTIDQRTITTQIEAINREVARARNDGDPVTATANATRLITALQDKSRALEEQAQAKKDKIAADGAKRRLEEAKKELAEGARTREAAAKVDLELLKSQEAAVTGESSKALRERLDIRRKLSEQQESIEIDSLVASNEEYIRAWAELAQARVIASSESASAEERAAAAARIASLEEGLKQTEARVRESDKRIQARRATGAAERKRDEITTEREISAKAEDERLRRIPNLMERERETRLSELKKTLDEELAFAEGNEELITAAKEREAEARYKIEEEYRDKTDALYGLAMAGFRNFINSKEADARRGRRSELEDERSKLDAEQQDLDRSLARKRVTLAEYDAKVGEITKKRADLDRQIEENQFDLLQRTQFAAGEAFKYAQERFSKQNEDALGKASVKLAAIGADMAAGAITGGEAASKSLEALKDVGVSALATVGAQMAQLALLTKANFGEIAAAAAVTLISIAENAILSNAVTIYSTAIGMLGPIAGATAATGAIIFVEGLLAFAKSKLQENLPKFHTGGVGIRSPRGRGQEFGAVLMDEESVMTPEATRANADAFRWANRTGRSLKEYYGDHRVYDERVRQGVISPIVVIIQERNAAAFDSRGLEDRIRRLEEIAEAQTRILADADFRLGRIQDYLFEIKNREVALAPEIDRDAILYRLMDLITKEQKRGVY